LEFLLQAAAILRDSGERFGVLVAGGGVLKDALHSQALDLGLAEHVRFLGWVPQASDCVLPNCDIFVQSSLWEAMSIVVLEAMAAGKPMVVTRVGENSHVVIDNETGLTVPPANPEALATALRKLLHNDDLRRRLGHAARLRYESAFTTQHMITAYEDLYRKLVGDALTIDPCDTARS
jgi:glycosyltransferase involved in cell wall biosynthesis